MNPHQAILDAVRDSAYPNRFTALQDTCGRFGGEDPKGYFWIVDAAVTAGMGVSDQPLEYADLVTWTEPELALHVQRAFEEFSEFNGLDVAIDAATAGQAARNALARRF